jgi:hypothetical protein
LLAAGGGHGVLDCYQSIDQLEEGRKDQAAACVVCVLLLDRQIAICMYIYSIQHIILYVLSVPNLAWGSDCSKLGIIGMQINMVRLAWDGIME